MEHQKEHIFATDVESFCTLYMLDRPFADGMYASMELEVASLEVSQKGEGETLWVQRKAELLPQRELPGFLKRLLGATSKVTQTETWDAAAAAITLRIDVPVIGDRIQYGGTYTLTTTPDNHTKRLWRGHCHAKIPLVGRKVEAFFLKEMGEGVDQGAAFMQTWLAENT